MRELTEEQLQVIKESITKYALNISEEKKEWFISKFSGGLLNQNSKTGKQLEESQFENWGLEMVPADLMVNFQKKKGLKVENSCVHFKRCIASCLFWAGEQNIRKGPAILDGVLSPVIMKRIARDVFRMVYPLQFFAMLEMDIQQKNLLAKLAGKKAFFRLNTLQDRKWIDLIKKLSNIDFYDYSKNWASEKLDNYSVTFSYASESEVKISQQRLLEGYNVAVVFDVYRTHDLPLEWNGFPVIDGDKDDNIHQKKGKVIGLRVKQTLGSKKLESPSGIVQPK